MAHYTTLAYLVTAQVAEQLHIGPQHVRRLFARGVIRSIRPGKQYLTKQEWVDAYIEGGSLNGLPPLMPRRGR